VACRQARWELMPKTTKRNTHTPPENFSHELSAKLTPTAKAGQAGRFPQEAQRVSQNWTFVGLAMKPAWTQEQ
jgi:hypothetical protein